MEIPPLPDSASPFRLFFGGPDQPARQLRDLLESRVEAIPPGGEILWATYYFRDEALARSLVRAHRRGVAVRLVLEGRPRTRSANRAVESILREEPGLGTGLRTPVHRIPDNLRLRTGRLHEKLYWFSHPQPHALLGTFNPSGNDLEDPALLAEIGDQDRGHNVLVEISDPRLVEGLRRHADRLHGTCHGPWERLLPQNNAVLEADGTRIYTFPRLRRGVIAEILEGLEPASRLRLAVSHLNDGALLRLLAGLPGRGVEVEVLAHDTLRRVTRRAETALAGTVRFRRYRSPRGWPMHNKFMLLESPGGNRVIFGSMNLSTRSLHANHELLVVSESRRLVEGFRQRWDAMLKEAETFSDQPQAEEPDADNS